MKKTSIHIFLYVLSALFLLGFAVRFGMDAYNYNTYMGSAPLYAYALIRAFEFIIPSLIAFFIGFIIKGKTKKD